MQEAPAHPRERERLAALRELDILDTAAEAAYDELVSLAAEIAETPVALVSLVDEDRQWFKARHGLDASETPREVAFCAHAILDPDQMLQVADTWRDERFADNPLVTGGPRIRFYAGVPLRSPVQELPLGTLCVISDQPQELDDQQRRALQVLARQIERLFRLRLANRELLRQNRTLEQALASRDRFLANISHELRTPLNSVIGFSAILQRNRHGGLGARELDMVGRIANNGQNLLRLINQILDLNRVESGKQAPRLQEVDLVRLIRELCEDHAVQLDGRPVELRLDLPEHSVRCETDPDRLGQVLTNLLGNAMKFTDRGSITVGMAVDVRGRPLSITVTDTGIGIEEDQLERIFAAFEQVDGLPACRYGGTGLGLTIARALCASLGDRLTVRSRPGLGSAFTIDLAVATAENRRAEA